MYCPPHFNILNVSAWRGPEGNSGNDHGCPPPPVVTAGGVPSGRVWCEQSVWAVLSPV